MRLPPLFHHFRGADQASLGPGMAQAGGWLGVNGPGVIKRVFLEDKINFNIIMCSELVLDCISTLGNKVLQAFVVPGVAGACISQDKSRFQDPRHIVIL